MLAHTAYREAEAAVNSILGLPDEMSYRAVPSVIYTSPEAAAVGLTEEEALGQGLDIETARLSMNYSGRYLAEHDRGDGICKLIFDRGRRTLVGAHLLDAPLRTDCDLRHVHRQPDHAGADETVRLPPPHDGRDHPGGAVPGGTVTSGVLPIVFLIGV
jgi:hypothetical protein